MESKKKNITNNDIEAPRGKHNACIVSKVWTSIKIIIYLLIYQKNN